MMALINYDGVKTVTYFTDIKNLVILAPVDMKKMDTMHGTVMS